MAEREVQKLGTAAIGGETRLRSLFDHSLCIARELDNGFFDLFAIESDPVHFTQATITARACIVRVIVTPAPLHMPLECLTLGPITIRTSSNLPARDQGVDVLYSFDAQFLVIDGVADALEALDIGL